MSSCLIVVAGMPGSGKTLFTTIARRIGIPVVVMGDVVREEVARRGLKPTTDNLLKVAQELRDELGPNAIAILTMRRISEIASPFVVVDGVRSLSEVATFKERFRRVVVVAIHANPRLRFERLLARGRPGDPRSWREFVERDRKELEWGLGSVIATADIMLINEGSLDEFVERCRSTLLRVLRQWCT